MKKALFNNGNAVRNCGMVLLLVVLFSISTTSLFAQTNTKDANTIAAVLPTKDPAVATPVDGPAINADHSTWGTFIDKDTYVSRNGRMFKVGDKITLGRGKKPGGYFQYIKADLGIFGGNLSGNHNFETFTITSIKGFDSKKGKHGTPKVGIKANLTPYVIDIESALDTGVEEVK